MKRFIYRKLWRPTKPNRAKNFDFPRETKPFHLRNYWLQFVHQDNNQHFPDREKLLHCQTKDFALRNVNLTSGKCQKLHIPTCVDKQIWLFQNECLNFTHQGLNQRFCNCRAAFNITILRNVLNRKPYEPRKSKLFDFSWETNFCSLEQLVAFRSQGYQSTFFH